jgi:hypothetical protein
LREKCGKAAWETSTEGHRKEGRLERELVDRADILAHVVDAIAGADGGGVMTKEIVSEADTRSDGGRVVVVVGGAVRGAR